MSDFNTGFLYKVQEAIQVQLEGRRLMACCCSRGLWYRCRKALKGIAFTTAAWKCNNVCNFFLEKEFLFALKHVGFFFFFKLLLKIQMHLIFSKFEMLHISREMMGRSLGKVVRSRTNTRVIQRIVCLPQHSIEVEMEAEDDPRSQAIFICSYTCSRERTCWLKWWGQRFVLSRLS